MVIPAEPSEVIIIGKDEVIRKLYLSLWKELPLQKRSQRFFLRAGHYAHFRYQLAPGLFVNFFLLLSEEETSTECVTTDLLKS